MGLFTWLMGCKNSDAQKQETTNQDNIALPDIASRINVADGFVDVFFKIVSDKKSDSSHVYIAKGLYKGKVVGLEFNIKSKIPAGIANRQISGNGSVNSGVIITSIGDESDEFIKAISELYKFPTIKPFSKRVIYTNLYSLSEANTNLEGNGKYHYKLFFDDDAAEIFLNLNLNDREIELSEKDVDYREPLIKIWTE